MDKLGACQQVKLEDLVVNRDLSFVGFTAQMFLEVGGELHSAGTEMLVAISKQHPSSCTNPSRQGSLDKQAAGCCFSCAMHFASAVLPDNPRYSLGCKQHVNKYTALQMCILAGCDFVTALSGIGVRKAHQHVKRLRDFTRVGCAFLCYQLGTCSRSLSCPVPDRDNQVYKNHQCSHPNAILSSCNGRW